MNVERLVEIRTAEPDPERRSGEISYRRISGRIMPLVP